MTQHVLFLKLATLLGHADSLVAFTFCFSATVGDVSDHATRLAIFSPFEPTVRGDISEVVDGIETQNRGLAVADIKANATSEAAA